MFCVCHFLKSLSSSPPALTKVNLSVRALSLIFACLLLSHRKMANFLDDFDGSLVALSYGGEIVKKCYSLFILVNEYFN